jgi:hypothetical protein
VPAGDTGLPQREQFLGLKFYQDPTNEIWYSTLNVSGQSGIKYVALVIPQGNQYGLTPTLNASNRTSSSLRYTNFTDVRVVAPRRS